MTLGLEQLAWRAPAHPDEAANTDTPTTELSPREASLVEIAADVVRGAANPQFQTHLEIALMHAGLTHEEVRELLRHLVPYAGLSATAMAFERMVELTDCPPAEAREDDRPDFAAEPEEYSPWALEGIASLDRPFAGQLRRHTSELWGRPGLSKRERAMATLAVDLASGALGGLFAVHVAVAQQNGIGLEEVSAMIRLLGERSPGDEGEALDAIAAIAVA